MARLFGINLETLVGLLMGTSLIHPGHGEKFTLYDFTTMDNVDAWRELSDTVRSVGKSKAVITLQTTQAFQRAVFFTMLIPQPNGAGFAGVETPTNLNLSNYTNIEITCRGQGQNDHYKVVLRHRGLNTNQDLTYEQIFTVPVADENFTVVKLPLREFRAYYRGKQVPDADPLDKNHISMFGLQMYGGVYSLFKQSGVSALEVDTVVIS